MTQERKYTILWFSTGLLCVFLALLVVITGLSGKVLVTDAEGIPEAADAVLNCIRTGDWDTLQETVVSSPVLAPFVGEDGSAENQIWKSYQKSLQWSCPEGFTVRGPYVIQKVSVTCLDIPEITHVIAGILEDPDIHTADAIQYAAEQALGSDAARKQQEISLTFQRDGDKWLLIPDRAFQALLSGFTGR